MKMFVNDFEIIVFSVFITFCIAISLMKCLVVMRTDTPWQVSWPEGVTFAYLIYLVYTTI